MMDGLLLSKIENSGLEMQTAGGMFSEESTTSESERAVRRWEMVGNSRLYSVKLNSQFGSLVNFKKNT